MSMINDALRRARNGSRPAAVPPPELPPEPVAEAPMDLPPPPPMPTEPAFPAPPPLAMAMPDDALPAALETDEPRPARTNKVQLILAVLLVLAVSVVAVMNYWQKREQVVQVSANTGRKAILPNASALQTAAQTLAAVSNRHAVASAPAATSTVAAVPTPVPAPAPVVVAAPVPPPKFPSLRLQSIFYRPSNPSVMINGRTLFLEDEIQGVTVADIQPYSVTLVLSGHTNVLTLR